MNNIINLNKNDITLTEKDILLLDTNVWIYLFYPLGNYKRAISEKYSNFYKKILDSKCTIIVPALIISEFFNTCMKFEFSIYQDLDKEKYKNFKNDFRGTEEYKKVVEKLIDLIKNSILNSTILINDYFNETEIDNILCSDFEFDFNDKVLIEICKKYNAKILTHDKDFKSYRTDFCLDVLTFSN